MRNILLLIVWTIIAPRANDQPAKGDSLLKLLASAKTDTARLNLYFCLGEYYEYKAPDSAKDYYRRAIQLGTQINYTYGLIRLKRYFAGVCLVVSEFDSAIHFSRRSLELARQLKDSLDIDIALLNIRSSYRFLSDMESAVTCSLEGAKIPEVIGRKGIAAQLNNGLQVLYTTMGQYPKAISCGEKVLQQSSDLNNDIFLAVAINNLALSYMEIDSLIESAKVALTETKKVAGRSENISVLAAGFNNLSGIATNQGQYDLPGEYAKKSLNINQKLASPETQAVSIRALSIYYLHKKDYVNARLYVDSSLRLTESTNNLEEKGQTLRAMTNIAFASGELVGGEKYF